MFHKKRLKFSDMNLHTDNLSYLKHYAQSTNLLLYAFIICHVSGDFESRILVGTLNLKSFESGKFCYILNDFLSNPDIFLPVIFSVCGSTKMVDCMIQS